MTIWVLSAGLAVAIALLAVAAFYNRKILVAAERQRSAAIEFARSVSTSLNYTRVGQVADLNTVGRYHSWVRHTPSGVPAIESLAWCQYCGDERPSDPTVFDGTCYGLEAMYRLKKALRKIGAEEPVARNYEEKT